MMDRFVIAFLDPQTGNTDILKNLGELYRFDGGKERDLSPRPVTYIRVISPDGSSFLEHQSSGVDEPYPDWTNLSSLAGQRLVLNCQRETNRSDDDFCLSEKIHSVADSLPAQGCWVEVFVCMGTPCVQTLNEDSFVALYAALKRLRAWHNAVIWFITEDELNPLLQWRNYLQAEVIVSVTEATVPVRSPLWKGQMVVLDSRGNVQLGLRDMLLEWIGEDSGEVTNDVAEGAVEGNQGISVKNTCTCTSTGRGRDYLTHRLRPGLSLSPICEILEEVDVITIPAFLLSPCQLQLKQISSKDNAFMEHVNECSEVGYVLRLAYCRQEDIGTCGEGQPNTKNWKETMSANIASLHDIMEANEDITGYIHLLLVAGDCKKVQTPDNSTSCTAYILRSPTEINGGLVDFLHQQWLTRCGSPGESGDRVKSLVRELPVWNVPLVEKLEAVIVKTQREVLEAWLEERRIRGESVCMTEAELVSILRDVHSHVLEIAKDSCDAEVSLATKPYKLPDCQAPDAADNDWPEREALKLAENKSRKLARFMSSESLQQSSPIHPAEGTGKDGGDKSVDVCDFLKLFNPDGSAFGDSLTVIQAKEGSLMRKKMSSFDDRETKWPQSKDVKFHDIYYNIGRKSERLEAEYRKLQQRYVLSETRCTISTNSSGVLDHSCAKVKPRAVKKVTRSPVRRSPRKHAPSANRLIGNMETRRMSMTDDSMKKRKMEPLSQLTIKQPIRSLSAKASSRGGESQSAKEDIPPPKAAPVKNDKKASRSDRHKRRLQQIVQDVLTKKGVNSDNDLFKACSSKLFTVTKIYAMELPTSRNLVAEMTKIAEGQVQQVIDLEMMKRKDGQTR